MIWTILNLLCLVLVSVYLAVCLIKHRGIGWGAILLLPVLASGALFFFHFTTWSILLLAGVGFAMLHLGNQKVSWIFLCLFYLVEFGFCGLGLLSPQLVPQLGLMMTLVFFLAENNQRFLRRSYEESMMEYQNQVVKKQVEEVQNLYLTMRGWRHDYHNHIQALKAQLGMGQYELATEYLGRLEKDLDDIRQMVESGNVSLDAILNSKLSYAEKKEISLNFKATVPQKLTVSDIDLCVLIGNLIDNAVEACEKLPVKDRFLRLYIGVFRKQLYISVTNATNELVRKLDDEYITTKRGNHGHGLKRINNTVEKYGGFINRKNEPGVFATEIMLPLYPLSGHNHAIRARKMTIRARIVFCTQFYARIKAEKGRGKNESKTANHFTK